VGSSFPGEPFFLLRRVFCFFLVPPGIGLRGLEGVGDGIGEERGEEKVEVLARDPEHSVPSAESKGGASWTRSGSGTCSLIDATVLKTSKESTALIMSPVQRLKMFPDWVCEIHWSTLAKDTTIFHLSFHSEFISKKVRKVQLGCQIKRVIKKTG
jgi:hypothetical protein